ncbi:hypothetical protein LBMAG42_11540 [Deltaproteobacteria bacterium]|nr:hypothetical protein LBMAG42_11540 [Deltaproteobacteria bacterium]
MREVAFEWLPWGEAAFAKAREEHKPVLLHIGATWCHWCHVMDESTYPSARVGQLIRERFVAIRVDTDHRPDVNDRYNQGGWPTCAVLDADGEVLVGRLYMPPHELIPLLESCSSPGQRWVIGKPGAADLIEAPAAAPAVWAAVKKAYDPWHHGFGELEKFPHPGVLDWLADRAARDTDENGMLSKTLDAMAEKGLYDPEEGGFFRYATRDDWGEVHYEKLGEDQARLLRVYLRAGRQRAACERTVGWLIRRLWRDDVGAFAGSMDADESYYNQRPRGEAPPVDATVYAGWNAQIANTLLSAATAWDRPGLAELARLALLHVREHLLRADGAVLRTVGGVAGLLEDQAAVADAFAQLAQWTGDGGWLRDAERVLGFVDALVLPEGGYRDAPPGGVGLLAHTRRLLPGNAAIGEAAWRVAALTDDARWRTVAAEGERGARAEADRYGFMAAPYGALAERLAQKAVVVKVNGNEALFRALWARFDPDVIVRRVREGVPEGAALACSGSACARPARSIEEVQAQIAALRA